MRFHLGRLVAFFALLDGLGLFAASFQSDLGWPSRIAGLVGLVPAGVSLIQAGKVVVHSEDDDAGQWLLSGTVFFVIAVLVTGAAVGLRYV